MMMIASLGVSALFFLNKALSLTSPVVVSFIRVTDIVVSYILQVLVLHDHPSVLAILGSSFVIISVSVIYIYYQYYLLSLLLPACRPVCACADCPASPYPYHICLPCLTSLKTHVVWGSINLT